MIGTEQLIQLTQSFINGHNGFLNNYIKKVYVTRVLNPLTGAQVVKQVWPMKIWKMENVRDVEV